MASKQDEAAGERYLNATGEERIKLFLDPGPAGDVTRFGNIKPFQIPLLPHIALHSSTPGPLPSATFLYTVQPEHCNGYGALSGGAASAVLDFLTTLPICFITHPDWLYLGVSRTLSLTFLRSVAMGETVRIECEVLGIGRTQATVRGVMRSKDGGAMVSAEHGLVKFPKSRM